MVIISSLNLEIGLEEVVLEYTCTLKLLLVLLPAKNFLTISLINYEHLIIKVKGKNSQSSCIIASLYRPPNFDSLGLIILKNFTIISYLTNAAM